MRSLILTLPLFLLILFPAISGENGPAFEMNSRLGRGINIGNTFEAPSETAWGNPWNPEYARIISELGFDHIRVPVRWEPRSMEEPPYTIDPAFLEKIKEVIDTALNHRLHVIINMHHHDNLLQDPEGQKERFLSQWEQIAAYFSDYPDSLLFEVFNEPHGDFTPERWNLFFPEALSRIRTTNPDRIVLIGTAEWGGLSGLNHLVLPDDPNLILTVHYYSPFQFTHQGASWVSGSEAWLGTRWHDTETDREAVENDFRIALEFSQQHNIPVHVGEFGAYSRADMDSRSRWTTFVSRFYEQQGFSWAYWEFSAGFGIYNPSTGQLRQELVDALLHNSTGEPTQTLGDTIYASNFTASNDGWNLHAGSGASAAMTRVEGALEIVITSVGPDAWNVQLVRTGIQLENKKTYRVSFTASSPQNKSVTSYVGRASSPWTSYSGYNSIMISDDIHKYSYNFKMGDDSDQNARLVFDLGNNTTDFTLYEFVLEEITLVIPYSLTINAVNGSVTIDSETEVYMGGETYTLTAFADEGYVFVGWSGDAEGDENPLELYMNDDKNITANFAEIPVTFALTVSAENGSVTIDPEKDEYMDGETVTLTAVPDEGFIFAGWSGDAEGDENPLVLTMDSDKVITAGFDVDTGINWIPSVSELVFYPNPLSGGNLAIRTPFVSDIEIYNVLGTLLMRFDRVYELEIDRSGFDTGLYIIKVVNKNQVKSGMLLVQ